MTIPNQSMWSSKTYIFDYLRNRQWVSDQDFDSIYSASIKDLSRIHWTPVEVARFVAQILGNKPEARVLDVGCGPGKFCLIGACTSPATFHGVDHREHLIKEANRIAKTNHLKNIEFFHSNMTEFDWNSYDNFYLFNPFLENISKSAAIDATVLLSVDNYRRYVDFVQNRLRILPIGTRILTYHGFGGVVPDGYKLEVDRFIGSGSVESWVKVRPSENAMLPKYDLLAILEKAFKGDAESLKGS